jgi:hypothetical protein
MGWLMEIKEDSPARGGGYKIGSWLYEDETEARLDDNRSENEDWWWISKGSVVSIKKVE